MTDRDSWADGVRRTLTDLCAPPDAVNVLTLAFRQAAMEWADHPVSIPLAFSSGICPDGAPVEVSIRATEGYIRQWRFITQPHSSWLDTRDNFRHVVGRALNFVSTYSGSEAKRSVERCLGAFQYSAVATGNFLLWVGLAVHDSGEIGCSKVYLNPWSTHPSMQGGYSIYHFLSSAGVSEGAYAWIQHLISQTNSSPNILGLNLLSGCIDSAKVYFVSENLSLSSLLRLLRTWPVNSLDEDADLISSVVGSGASCGQVHFTLTFHPGHSDPDVKVNLFCPDWFSTDRAAVDAFDKSCGLSGVAAHLYSLCGASGSPRRFNFTGLDHLGATMYIKAVSLAK